MEIDLFNYPHSPGFKDRTTSQDAAIKMYEPAKHYRQKVLEALKDGPATPKELVGRIEGSKLDNIRPRTTELLSMGKIFRIGRRDGQHILALVNKLL